MKNINVIWIGKYIQGWEMLPHKHNFFQMIGVVSGSGSIRFGDQKDEICKETFYVFPPNQEHTINSSDKNALKILDIKFKAADPQVLQDILRLGTSFQITNFHFFTRQFDELLKESKSKGKYCDFWINSYFSCMLVHIIREKLYPELPEHDSCVSEEKENIKTIHGIQVKELCDYVNQNYASIISLEDLSRLAAINKTTLIAIFKDLFGSTPIQYINHLRLQKAKDLLINTDVNVSEISRLIGFQSIHYFSRYFKSKEKCAPTEFRIREKENKFFEIK